MTKEKFTVGEQNIELTESDAVDLITEIRSRFGWIGTNITPEDVESIIGEPVTPELWVQLEQELADDVLRLIESV